MNPIDLHDVQGGILKSYGRYGFPKAYFLFLAVTHEDKARAFVRKLTPSITTSIAWANVESGEKGFPKPTVTTNVAFSYRGLRAVGLPRESLQSFPDEFAMGMQPRRAILGDDGASAPERWDPMWNDPDAIHLMIWINGQTQQSVEERYRQIVDLVAAVGGVAILKGHRNQDGREDLPYQDATAIYQNGEPTPREHFGYVDGISDPFFKGVSAYEQNVMGGGKVTGKNPATRAGWAPLETGEFLLGHKDESCEWPEAPDPALLARNGTYVVYRKLHENVGAFDQYLDRMGRDFPGGPEALAAKFAGRWRNGAPLSTFPTEKDANDFAATWAAAKAAIHAAKTPEARNAAKQEFGRLNAKFTAYDFRDDLDGARCPLGAHVRRANPRSALEFGQDGAFETPGAVSNRRRILRRGLPYGDSSERRDEGEHGVIFMALNASIRRQFEFVQQQWINYGNDFQLANDKDPLLGNHGVGADGKGNGTMVVQVAKNDPKPPFICSHIPRFVETRGGEYFFMPSLTALRMIGAGSIDPT
jgi:Dyp-type peroxidase family